MDLPVCQFLDVQTSASANADSLSTGRSQWFKRVGGSIAGNRMVPKTRSHSFTDSIGANGERDAGINSLPNSHPLLEGNTRQIGRQPLRQPNFAVEPASKDG